MLSDFYHCMPVTRVTQMDEVVAFTEEIENARVVPNAVIGFAGPE